MPLQTVGWGQRATAYSTEHGVGADTLHAARWGPDRRWGPAPTVQGNQPLLLLPPPSQCNNSHLRCRGCEGSKNKQPQHLKALNEKLCRRALFSFSRHVRNRLVLRWVSPGLEAVSLPPRGALVAPGSRALLPGRSLSL